MADNNENIITLFDEEGNPVDFEMVDMIDYNDEKYAVMLPADSDSGLENNEVVILKVVLGDECCDDDCDCDECCDDDCDCDECCDDDCDCDECCDEISLVDVEDKTALEAVFELFKERNKDRFNFN